MGADREKAVAVVVDDPHYERGALSFFPYLLVREKRKLIEFVLGLLLL